MSRKLEVSFTINGHRQFVSVEPRRTLADVLRDDCGMTATHIGCEHGVCGTCTVIVDGAAVRSCLMFAVQAEGSEIRTVEGLSQGNELSPLQAAFMAHHSLQCGFCTPGFLMLGTQILEAHPLIGDDELIDLLSSNLCRCTGYLPIIEAVQSVRDAGQCSTKLASDTP